ncbi:MAG: hypothetical protein CMB80_07130 [Flammeovirgaceae bacterium]|nr:hypothetical protein [Flammeovirgaceae bacterium]MBE62960.1 hypothetical protein [Flammeovirgaceae bacterium]MBR08806.1 hypothetical protein [Rickettsiales bacterium]HCX21998.1 OmpA family protein [Cytophagales bacterium]|tara:strand:- start:64 stop:750 length:687 start_codon:yes stop_codon:yes gene_type:complete
MPKIAIALCLVILCSFSYGQGTEEYVRVYGQTLSAKDSSAISVSLLYEKLPYYDDMGMIKSSPEGRFEMFLLEGTDYDFKVTQEGFVAFEDQKKIVSEGDKEMKVDFYIQPEEEPELMTIQNLIFARGSERISESSYSSLDELVAYLDERPNMVIQLEGHTDFAGNAEANMALSQARVESVKDYLVSKGIKKNRLFTKAFGGSEPLTTERTDEAKARNRRVEVRVLRR